MVDGETPFLPKADEIYLADNSAKRDIAKLTEQAQIQYCRFLQELRVGKIPAGGKNISRQNQVIKYRLNGNERVAFVMKLDNKKRRAIILGAGNHPRMDEIRQRYK